MNEKYHVTIFLTFENLKTFLKKKIPENVNTFSKN